MDERPRQTHELLEDALLRVRDVVDDGIDRAELMQLIASSLHQHYRALAASGADATYSDAMVVASLEIDRAIEAIPEGCTDEIAAALRAELIAAAKDARRASPLEPEVRLPSTDQGWRGPRASVDVPVLLDPPRDVAEPAIPVRWRTREPDVYVERPPDPPPVASLEELDALLAQPSSPPAERARPRAREASSPARVQPVASEHLAKMADTLVEELGVLGLLRHQLDGQTWTGKERIERRLLARVDAIVSCGAHCLPKLVRKLERRPVPDAELTWGLLYLFGSIAGDDMVDEALRLARASSLDVIEVRDAIADAFAIMPNVRIEPRLRAWLGSGAAHERAVAVHALGRRGALTADEVRMAADDAELIVVREAALAFTTASGRIDVDAVDRLLHHDDGLVVQRTMFGSILRHDVAGAQRARSLVRAHRGAFARAGIAHALAEGRDALDALLEDAAVSGSPIALAALGWFGHVSVLPYLIGRLESDDPATTTSAASAIARIVGAHEQRDSFPHARPRMPKSVHADPKTWRSWWRAQERRIDSKVRYRFGAPWRHSSNVLELEYEQSPSSSRSLAHMELVARIGLAAPFDPQAFVARQRIRIEMIRERANLGAAGTSGWPVHLPI